MRHRLRMHQDDPVREIANLDRLTERCGRPGRVIQHGCSGGGHLTLAVAEDFPDRVEGWFALQMLLGPAYEAAGHGAASDLAITGPESCRTPGAARRRRPRRRRRGGRASPWPSRPGSTKHEATSHASKLTHDRREGSLDSPGADS